MTNMSPRLKTANATILVTQKFGYRHYWITENTTSTLKERSGNPGYLPGKPVMTGILAIGDLELIKNEDKLQTVTHSDLFIDRGYEESSQFLSIMANNGECYGFKRFNDEKFDNSLRFGLVF